MPKLSLIHHGHMSICRRTVRLVVLAPCLLLDGCGDDSLCSSKVVDVARDPGSDRYAVTEVRNCGATTSFVTLVRVGRASEAQADDVEVFVADSDHDAAAEGAGGGIWTDVTWPESGRLSVIYASRARVYKSKKSAESVQVSYRASDPLSSLPPS